MALAEYKVRKEAGRLSIRCFRTSRCPKTALLSPILGVRAWGMLSERGLAPMTVTWTITDRLNFSSIIPRLSPDCCADTIGAVADSGQNRDLVEGHGAVHETMVRLRCSLAYVASLAHSVLPNLAASPMWRAPASRLLSYFPPAEASNIFEN